MSQSPSNPWFALQVFPRMEMRVASMLEVKGIDHLLPKYRSKRVWCDRVKSLEVPLFPGYVFCRLPERNGPLAVSTPGVTRIVSFGGTPYPLSEDEVLALQKMSCSNVGVKPCPFQQIGQKVRIMDGPLAGVVGTVAGTKKKQLVISIEMLMRSVAVDIDLQQVCVMDAGSTGFEVVSGH
ncbi:MAG TPA: transcription termination/antitermination NusG family protein [Terriglobales bacterium]